MEIKTFRDRKIDRQQHRRSNIDIKHRHQTSTIKHAAFFTPMSQRVFEKSVNQPSVSRKISIQVDESLSPVYLPI